MQREVRKIACTFRCLDRNLPARLPSDRTYPIRAGGLHARHLAKVIVCLVPTTRPGVPGVCGTGESDRSLETSSSPAYALHCGRRDR